MWRVPSPAEEQASLFKHTEQFWHSKCSPTLHSSCSLQVNFLPFFSSSNIHVFYHQHFVFLQTSVFCSLKFLVKQYCFPSCEQLFELVPTYFLCPPPPTPQSHSTLLFHHFFAPVKLTDRDKCHSGLRSPITLPTHSYSRCNNTILILFLFPTLSDLEYCICLFWSALHAETCLMKLM